MMNENNFTRDRKKEFGFLPICVLHVKSYNVM